MDYNQLYGQFSNEFWSHFQSSELAQGRKSATFQQYNLNGARTLPDEPLVGLWLL